MKNKIIFQLQYDTIVVMLVIFKKILLVFLLCSLILSQKQLLAQLTVHVTAKVAAKASDFPLTITSSPTQAVFAQDSVLTYTISYGSNLAYTTPLTVQAQWYQGTITGQASPSVDIVDYVIGSASNGYGNSVPVIDIVHKTITWTISSIPASTINQTVTFQLRTNSSYTGQNTVTFPVAARIIQSDVTVPDAIKTNTYQYDASITPTPTFTPTPTSTPIQSGPTPTVTPTSTPSTKSGAVLYPTTAQPPTNTPVLPQQTFRITDVSVKTVSSQNVTVGITTNQPSTLAIEYGESIHNLNQKITDLISITSHTITFSSLKPDTIYYFQITAVSQTKQSFNSEYFTFRTSLIPTTVHIDRPTIIVTSDNNILFDFLQNYNNQLKDTVVVLQNTIYDFQFALVNAENVEKIHAYIANNTNAVDLVEIKPGVFAGRLQSAAAPNFNELAIIVYDTRGNITQEKLVDVKAVKPLTIFDQQTKKPIEKARVVLSFYNESKHAYEEISSQTLSIKNPSFSNTLGEINIGLPQGQYKAHVSASFYKEATIKFTIAPDRNNDYPQIYLSSDKFNFFSVLNYYSDIAGDLLQSTREYLQTITGSFRFFNLIAIVSLCSMVLLTVFAFTRRTGVSFLAMPLVLYCEIEHILYKRHNAMIVGKVIDEITEKPLSHVLVTVIDADHNRILAKLLTNSLGEFAIKQPSYKNYKFAIIKNGYEMHPFFEYSAEALQSGTIILELKKEEQNKNVFRQVIKMGENILDASFEALLFTTLLLELLFGFTLGWLKAAPFIGMSLFNLTNWILYAVKSKKGGLT